MDVIQDIFKTLSLPEFYFAMFRSATPVLLTTLGAMISSRSGTSYCLLRNHADLRLCGCCCQRFFPECLDRISGCCLRRLCDQQYSGLLYFEIKIKCSHLRYRDQYAGLRRNDLCPVSDHRGERSFHLPSFPEAASIDIPLIEDIPVLGARLPGIIF